jgi:S1-C subfamily serine protease
MSGATSKAGWLVAGLLVAALIVVALVAAGVLSTGNDESSAMTPLQIYERDAPGVVEVRAMFGADSGSLGSTSGGSGLGTGFLVSTDGYIITNAHVVTSDGVDATKVAVVFKRGEESSAGGASVTAALIGSDEDTDIALLQIDPDDAPVLHPLTLGDGASVQVGEPVVALGSPLDLSFSLSSGIVSATDRNLRSPNGLVIPDGIQTDAAINSGDSGGPLIDSSGEVIGVNTQIMTQSGGSQGLGFAVSVDTAVRVMEQMKETGAASSAYLGATGFALSPDIALVLGTGADSGVLVTYVAAGSPAAEADIRGGDRQVVV